MIPLDLAIRLRDAGLVWKPAPGDWFAVPDRDLDDDFFVLSDMTIQVYEVPEGSLIGFNGTPSGRWTTSTRTRRSGCPARTSCASCSVRRSSG